MTEIELFMPRRGIRAIATLLEDQAPKTCEAILKLLPKEFKFITCAWSGAEILTYLDPPNIIRVEPENLVKDVIPGDICYVYMPGPVEEDSSYVGSSKTDYAEIVIYYDRHARCSGGVNLFARITEGLGEFAEAAEKIRWEGAETIRFRRV